MKTEMKTRALLLALGVLAMSAPAFASETPAEEESIPFVSQDGIQNWRADGDTALYIEGRGKQWYRAELMGHCTGLDFASKIGVEGGTLNRFDRFSKIVVDGRTCQVKSVVKAEDPTKAPAQ